jgi:hypothetical protein
VPDGEIGVLDLLRLKGFDTTKRVKFVRHKGASVDVHDFLRRGWLETYQSYQAKPVFAKADVVVAFVGLGGTRARLEGVYAVGKCAPFVGKQKLPKGMPRKWLDESGYRYDLRRLQGFEELENRVVVDWGAGALAWVQWATNKRVIEMLPTGQLLRPFTDYLGFTLTRSELVHLCSDPEANKEWRARLSAVAGVYLILATTTGAQYVGSAHGAEGFWGRWAGYARSGHGGNLLLRKLMSEDRGYPDAFSYSILQILPRTATHNEVLNWERLYKVKLGSRAIGLNAN